MVSLILVRWTMIHMVDSAIQRLNNRDLFTNTVETLYRPTIFFCFARYTFETVVIITMVIPILVC